MNTINTSKKSTITADLFVPKMTLTLTFINGKEIVIDANALNPEIRDMALLHGLKQKLVDAAAISRNVETGKSASADDKYDAVKKIADRLMSPEGRWNEGRVAGEPATSASVNSILIRAVMKMTGHSEAYTKDWLADKTKEQRAALRKNPRVVQIMAELSAATVVNGVNTDELLNELGLANATDEAVDATAGDGSGIESDIVDEPVATPAKPNTRTSKKRLASAAAE
jgi:hypothetical protein